MPDDLPDTPLLLWNNDRERHALANVIVAAMRCAEADCTPVENPFLSEPARQIWELTTLAFEKLQRL